MDSEGERAAVMAWLTNAHMELLANLPLTGKGNPPEGHWVLWDAGLASCQITGNDAASRWNITITPLGLTVRAAIARGDHLPHPDQTNG